MIEETASEVPPPASRMKGLVEWLVGLFRVTPPAPGTVWIECDQWELDPKMVVVVKANARWTKYEFHIPPISGRDQPARDPWPFKMETRQFLREYKPLSMIADGDARNCH